MQSTPKPQIILYSRFTSTCFLGVYEQGTEIIT